MTSGELLLGHSWDDLYQHITDLKFDGNAGLFAGFLGFWCFTKYNNGSENNLTSMAIDDTEISGGENGRGSSRKKLKLDKDNEYSICALEDKSPFKARGLSIEYMMDIAELAQLED